MAPTAPTQNAGASPKSSNQEPQLAMGSWRKKARDAVAPIPGDGPNNAENDDHAERGAHPPHPQLHITTSTQRRAPPDGSSPTGYLRTSGVQSGDSAQNPGDTHLHKAGRNRNANFISTNGRVKQPRYIDLDIDSYSYSRDAIGQSTDRSGIYSYTARPVPDSPDDYRRSIASSSTLNRVPEEMESGADTPEQRQQNRRSNPIRRGNSPQPYYGSVGQGATSSRGYPGVDLLNLDAESDSVEEEEEWFLDEELARQGLYRGNYQSLLLLYTFVPFTAILAFIFLGLLPTLAFPSSSPSPFPYPPYLPFPLPEVCTATALWSLSYLIRDFLYATSLSGTSLISFPTARFPSFIPILTSLVSAFLQSASALFFRQLAVPILLIPFYSAERMGLLWPIVSAGHKHHFPTWQDDAFKRVWWVALGWAAAEAVVGIKQGYESISLYKDVLVSVKRVVSKAEVMVTTRSANVSDEEGQDRQGDIDDAIKDAPVRSLSPVSYRINEGDASATPTQKKLNSSQEGVTSADSPENLDALPPPLITFPTKHQNSLSSLSSISQLEDLSRSVTMGERQPLLPLNRPSHRQTQESERLLAENAVERDLEELMALKSREELEEVYGIPVINIPVFISCLHRINSILSSLGITLLLTAAYMRSTFAYHPPLDMRYNPPTFAPIPITSPPFRPSNRTLLCTIPPILVVQTVLAMMHTPWILPRIGIHTFVYINLLVSLGYFFGGLGLWEALI
ncbi:hypothetical protein M413DRAFT_445020 [Hebeloma cylindrosporum]|uniref:Uncharacterized protein n=1 Tax=Hebeloma cylindrosporum TaxID=76867 RepID=A0A0C2XVX4_HEBCY|nr:hypothetical protein M413DRAFT_445020 [Hebeloma cylindrosporum h7]